MAAIAVLEQGYVRFWQYQPFGIRFRKEALAQDLPAAAYPDHAFHEGQIKRPTPPEADILLAGIEWLPTDQSLPAESGRLVANLGQTNAHLPHIGHRDAITVPYVPLIRS